MKEIEIRQKSEEKLITHKRRELEAQEVVADVLVMFDDIEDDDEMNRLEEKQREELMQVEKILKEAEDSEVDKMLKSSSLNDLRLVKQRERLEKQKKILGQYVKSAMDDEEKKGILDELAETEGKLKETIEEQEVD